MASITVIIPTCDRGALLLESLRSVFAQTKAADEIIVVNNGKAPVELPQGFKGVKMLAMEPYAGVAKARNRGADAATGEFVAFLDDDDLWSETYLEEVAKALDAGADATVGVLDALEGNTVLPYKDAAGRLTVRDLLLYNPGVTGSNIVVKRSVLIETGGFDPLLPPSEDKALLLELVRKSARVRFVPSAKALHRQHGGNRLTSSRKLARGIRAFTKKYRELMDTETFLFNMKKSAEHELAAKRLLALPRFLVAAASLKLAKAARALRPVRIYPRPSKTFLFEKLRRVLLERRGMVGIDAASADFKNRPLFGTELYVGIDLDEEALKRGRARYPQGTVAIRASIAELDALTARSADVIVSTNTLDHLSGKEKLAAVQGFLRLAAPGASLVLHLSKGSEDAELLRELRGQCEKISVSNSRNILSAFFERTLEKNGVLDFGTHSGLRGKLIIFFSWLLFFGEALLSKVGPLNAQMIIVARKGRTGTRQEFSLASLTKDGLPSLV